MSLLVQWSVSKHGTCVGSNSRLPQVEENSIATKNESELANFKLALKEFLYKKKKKNTE